MEESERIYECNTAKSIWDTLKIHHEGTSHVKETRIDIGVRKFEIFEMNEEENIDEMYSRFTSIVNELRSLGKIYSPHDRIRKILRCLPISWRPMVTAITQAKDLNVLALEDLIGTLRAHEFLLQEDKPNKKGKMIALKASENNLEESPSQVEEKETEEEQMIQEEAEDELALITKKVQRMIRRRDQIKRYFPTRRDNSKREVDKSQVTCYGCNNKGHYKNECPQNKKNQKSPYKKSALITWDNLEETQAEEEEEANICLMANSDNEEVILLDKSPLNTELEKTIDSLLFDSNFLTNKCYSLQKEINDLKEEKEKLKTLNNDQKKTIQSLQDSYFQATEKMKELGKTQNPNINENAILKNEVKHLRNDLTHFIKSTETFQKIMGSQKGMTDQTGVGFDISKNQKIYENYFIPEKDKLKCSFCDKNGHIESFCFHKKRLAKARPEYFYLTKPEHSFQSKERSLCSYCKRSGHLEINCFLKIKNLELMKTNNEGPTKSWGPKIALTRNAGILSKLKEKAMVFGQWLF